MCMHLFIKFSENRIKASVKVETCASQTTNTNVKHNNKGLIPLRELNLVFNQLI